MYVCMYSYGERKGRGCVVITEFTSNDNLMKDKGKKQIFFECLLNAKHCDSRFKNFISILTTFRKVGAFISNLRMMNLKLRS